MGNYVVVDKLTKKYGDVCAVDTLSFTVDEGEIFGFLGPNGAGKSTTLNVLTTLTDFDRGTVTINGWDLCRERERIRPLIGMVPQEIAVYPMLSAYENVSFFASLYGLSGQKRRDAAREALSFVGLADRAGMQPRRMSGGMRRRLNIACGIVHSPKLIVLDEPTVGVDAQSREHILGAIRTLRERGATVIYTSHYMPEVQEICDRVAIIDKGRLAACGTEEELMSLVTDVKSVYVETRFPQDFDREALRRRLALLPDVKKIEFQDNNLRVDMGLARNGVAPVLQSLLEEGLPLLEVRSEAPNLETTFLALTGHDLR